MKKKSTRDMVISVNKHQEPSPEVVVHPEIRPSKAVTFIKSDYEPDEIPTEDQKPKTIRKTKAKREKRKRPERAAQKSSSPILKSKIFWGCASLLIAFLLAFVVMPIIENSYNQMVSVLVAAQDIPEGMKIESSMLQQKEICKVDVLPNTLLAEGDAIGKYTEVTLLTGDMLTSTKIGETYYDDTYLYDLPDGKMAMSIGLSDLAQSVSGKIRSGDVVRIYAIYNKNNNTDSVNASDYSASLIDELQYVEVLSVTNSDVQDIKASSAQANVNTSEQPGKESDVKKSIATVTLLVNNRQAEVLAGLNSNATLYSALVVRGDNAKMQAALEAQDKYLNDELAQKKTNTVKGESANSEDNSIVG